MCPVCGRGLERQPTRFACADGHSFDVAREGYVNLLLTHHRRSAIAGDPSSSVQSRRAFLEAGHFEPLAVMLRQLAGETAADRADGCRVLDAGCGEGYFLRQLLGVGAELRGVDIAKPAIRLAARGAPDVEFAVGNTFHLPVLPGAVDIVVQVLAPGDPSEFRRVLRGAGAFLSVIPGPGHLQGLRGLVYDEPRPHEDKGTPPGFVLRQEQRVQCPVVLRTAEEVAALVEMTPYKWHMNPETAARVGTLAELDDIADFTIRMYEIKGD